MSSATRILLAIASGTCAVTMCYVLLVSTNVPTFDDWYYAPMMDKWFSGTLDVAELFKPFSHTRMPLPSAVQLALASLTRWNTQAPLLLIVVIMVSTATLIARTISRTASANLPASVRALGTAAPLLLLMSLRNWENFLLSMQINMALGVCLFVVAAYLLPQEHTGAIIAAATSAFGASFSYTNSLLIWPLGLLVLLIQKRYKSAAAWLLMAVCLVTYYTGSGWSGGDQLTGGHPLALVHYSLLQVGSPLALAHAIISADGSLITSNALTISVVLGIVVLLAAGQALALTLMQSKTEGRLFFASLIGYGLATVAAVAVARLHFGVTQALSSHYAWFSSLTICGTLGILLSEPSSRTRFPAFLATGLASLAVASYFLALVAESRTGAYRHAYFVEWANTVQHHRTMPDDKVKDHLRPTKYMRPAIEVLERHKLGVFSR